MEDVADGSEPRLVEVVGRFEGADANLIRDGHGSIPAPTPCGINDYEFDCIASTGRFARRTCRPGARPGGALWAGRPRRVKLVRAAPAPAATAGPEGRVRLIRETVGHLRDLPRYRQILASLVRYGYRDVVAALHLDRLVRPFERAALGDEVPPHDRPMRLRLVCEDLGPTFVKLGQILSTRPDLLPEAYTTELAAAPRPRQAVPLRRGRGDPGRGVRPARLGGLRLDRARAAGLGVDLAGPPRRPPRRPDDRPEDPPAGDREDGPGRPRHPQEPRPARRAAAARRWPLTARWRWPASSSGRLKRELDFTVERRTMERCRAQFARDPTAHIPDVVREYSTPRVLAMELIGGVGVDRPGRASGGSGVDPAEVAVRGARILLTADLPVRLLPRRPPPGQPPRPRRRRDRPARLRDVRPDRRPDPRADRRPPRWA